MTTATIEKPATYAERVDALLAKGSPVRIFDQYEKFKAASR